MLYAIMASDIEYQLQQSCRGNLVLIGVLNFHVCHGLPQRWFHSQTSYDSPIKPENTSTFASSRPSTLPSWASIEVVTRISWSSGKQLYWLGILKGAPCCLDTPKSLIIWLAVSHKVHLFVVKTTCTRMFALRWKLKELISSTNMHYT